MNELFENPANTREEILAATYRALVEHGYADLTIQTIGDEFSKSPSLVYHHYDSKDDLVLACLEFMLDEFEAEMTTPGLDDPHDRLEMFLAWVFEPTIDDDRLGFFGTLFELRARATSDEDYRDHFRRSDRVFERYVAATIRDGIDAGVFRDCSPEAVASTLVTILIGGTSRRSIDGDAAWLDDVRNQLRAYLSSQVDPDATTMTFVSDHTES